MAANQLGATNQQLFDYAERLHSGFRKWKDMDEDARYGALIILDMHPMEADKYNKLDISLLPTEYFEKLV